MDKVNMNVHGGVYGQAQHKMCLIFIVFLKHSWYNFRIFSSRDASSVYFVSIILLFICLCVLTGNIPPSLSKLQNLEWLYLDNNYLIGHIPTTLSNLTHLQYLGLSTNNLTGKRVLNGWVLIFAMILNLGLSWIHECLRL